MLGECGFVPSLQQIPQRDCLSHAENFCCPGTIRFALADGPDVVGTVFAGADIEATDRARGYFAPFPPSSPSVGLLRDGALVFMLQRSDIENRDARQIAERLTAAFDEYCGTPAV